MPILNNDGLDDPLLFERCPSFSGGQVSFERANILQPNQAALLENVTILINGELRKRRGTRPLGSSRITATAARIQAVLNYETAAINRIVAWQNGAALYYDGSAWQSYFAADIADTDEIISAVQLTDRIYFTDSNKTGIRLFDGANVRTVTSGYTAGNGGVRAVAWDGENVRAGVSATSNNVLTLDAGRVLDAYTAGAQYVTALCWDGTNLWAGLNAATNNLVKLNSDGSIAATVTVGSAAVRALAWDGTNLWIGVDAASNNLMKANSGGTVTATYTVGSAGIIALAWNGTTLWAGINANTNNFLTVNSSGTVTNTYTVGTSGVTGIAWDGTNLWTTAGTTSNNLRKVDTSGTTLNTYTVGAYALTGVAWDGAALWCSNGRDSSNLFEVAAAGTTSGTFTALASNSPVATILELHGNRLAASGVASIPDAVYFSDILDGETWDQTNNVLRVGAGDGDPVVAIKSWQETGLLVFKRNSVWLVDASPLTTVANMTIRNVHSTVGCIAKNSVAQVGQDVWFLSRTGVQSVRKQFATSNNEITVPVSQPIQDVINNIQWNHAHKSTAVFYNNFYLLSVPVESSEPDTVLVYHYLTGGWTIFKQWDASILFEQPYEGKTRLLIGTAEGELREWLEYIEESAEPSDAYKDGYTSLELPLTLPTTFLPGPDVECRAITRAQTFSEPVNPKSGFYAEVEVVTTDVEAELFAVLDGRDRISLGELTYTLEQALLPATLPFSLPVEGWARNRFPLHHLPPFREFQFDIVCSSGKLVLRDITTSAFLDTIELRQ